MKREVMNLALEEESMLLLGAGNRTIRTRPNLNVTGEEIDLFVERLDRVLLQTGR